MEITMKTPKKSLRHLVILTSLILGLAHLKAQSPAHTVKLIPDIEFAKPDGVTLLMNLRLPEGVENPPLVMFIHGGSWRTGDRKSGRIDWLAGHGFAVADIEYRLSQEALFPAQIHDCKGALRWLRANAKTYGYDADRVVVAGTSAGGHLATLLGTSAGVAALEGDTGGNAEQSSRVLGILDYYGPSDFESRSKTHPEKCEDPAGGVYQLLGGKVSENLEAARLASPVTHITADDPPLLILHGDKDNTVKFDQTEILRDRYRAAGLEVNLYIKAGAGHGWREPDAQEKKIVIDTLTRWFARKG